MQPNKKLLAKKRKAQQEALQKQNEKRQIAEASNVAPEGITNRLNQQRKALVTKSKTSSSSAHHQVQNKTQKLSAADLKRQQQQIGSDLDDDDNDDQEQQEEMSLHSGDDNHNNNTLSKQHETKSNTGLSTATTSVVNRLATLLDAPADGRAFFALSSKIGHEEKALSGAKKMSAKRRTRLEIAERDDEVDEVDGDDDDDDEANEMRSTQKTFNKNKKILEVVDDVGPIAPAKRDELKRFQQQQQQQESKNNKKKSLKEDDAAADSEGDDSEDDEAKAGMKLLKTALRNQNHKKVLPHQDRPDYEYRLRRVATSGCVRLFNALAQAQSAGADAAHEAQKEMTQDKAESHKIVASRDAFMSALRGAASSSRKH